MKVKLLFIYILTAMTLIFTACGNSPTTTEKDNRIIAKITADTYTITPNSTVHLSAASSTISGDVTYTWLDSQGTTLATTPQTTWTAPSTEGSYTIILVLNYKQPNQSTDTISIMVKNTLPNTYDTNDSTFGTIQEMIKQSKNGQLANVTYICVGDSTRAHTILPADASYSYVSRDNHSDYIFRDVNASLQNYAVNGYLKSEGGLALRTFLGGTPYNPADKRDWIQIQEVIDLIPGDGNTTILDMSLAANDLSGLNEVYGYQPTLLHDEIKSMLKEAINRFRTAKPRVKIMLTSPNPMRDWKNGAAIYQNVYQEVATEENLPFANFVATMPAHGSQEFLSYYNDNIHFGTAVGIPRLSNFLLQQLLPANE